MWLGSNQGSDRTRLVRLDVATGVETEIDSHPTFDLGGQLGLASPLNTRQILVVNLITDALPALSVTLQAPEHRRQFP